MKDLRSSRRLIKMRQRREKATIAHPVHPAGAPRDTSRPTHSAFTASGLAIEDQVRKAWRPWSTGLAVF